MGQGTYSLFINTYGVVKSNHHSNKLHSDVGIKVIIKIKVELEI